MPPRLLVALAALALASCSSLVPTTAAQLSRLDPLTADPGDIQLVAVLPPGLAVRPGSAVLVMSATRGQQSQSGRFVLRDVAALPEVAVPKGGTARVYALTEADAERMRTLQAGISKWKREGEAKGSLSLGIGGCTVDKGPAQDAVGSVLIRLAPDQPFLPLIRDGRLSQLLGPEHMAGLGPCQGSE